MVKFIWLLGILVVTGCGRTGSVHTIKLGHGLDTNHPVHQAMVYMQKRVDENQTALCTFRFIPVSNWEPNDSYSNFCSWAVWG